MAIIVDIKLREIDIRFQVETFSCQKLCKNADGSGRFASVRTARRGVALVLLPYTFITI